MSGAVPRISATSASSMPTKAICSLTKRSMSAPGWTRSTSLMDVEHSAFPLMRHAPVRRIRSGSNLTGGGGAASVDVHGGHESFLLGRRAQGMCRHLRTAIILLVVLLAGLPAKAAQNAQPQSPESLAPAQGVTVDRGVLT